MFNKIDEVQRQYTYAVQPVKLFETKNSQQAQQFAFDFIARIKETGHNPFHPSVANSDRGNRLDFMG